MFTAVVFLGVVVVVVAVVEIHRRWVHGLLSSESSFFCSQFLEEVRVDRGR